MALLFQRLTEAELPTLAEWLKRPHVAEWWEGCENVKELRDQYLPRLEDRSTVVPYLAYLDGFRLATSSRTCQPRRAMVGGRMSMTLAFVA